MVSAKRAVQEVLEKLPDDVTFEEIQYRIYVREKIEAGLADVDEGKVLDEDELESRIAKWRAK